MNTVFIDFDGVLFNTLKEAYILCRKTYNKTDYFTPIDNNEFERFYRYKFLVFNSWQYLYIMKLLKETLSDEDFIKKYNDFMENRDLSEEKDFDLKYYSFREDLMTNYKTFWDTLETPFPFLNKLKEAVTSKQVKPVIVSKKNKTAILNRFNQYSFPISKTDVYGKDELESYKLKSDFINEYMKNNGINKACFVDDNSNNFQGCNSNTIQLLAGWGNIAINEKGLTSEEIISKITSDID